MIEYVLFDLDGTLTDSAPGILNSIEYAINKMGFEKESRENLSRFLGPPLTEAFSEYFNLNLEDAYKMVECYREYYRDKGIFENNLYDGIKDLLNNISSKKIGLATSKPEHFAIQILKHFDLFKYFDVVCGSPVKETKCSKGDIIKRALEELNADDKSKVVMVGDRKYDATGSKEAGIKSVGVLYGYGDKKELEDAKFDYICETVKDLKDILRKM